LEAEFMVHEKRRRAVLDAKMAELSQTEGKLKAALFEVIATLHMHTDAHVVSRQVYIIKWSWGGEGAAADARPQILNPKT
jgi:hypothetical protein